MSESNGGQGISSLPQIELVSGDVSSTDLLERASVLAVPVASSPEDDDGVQPRVGTVDAAVRYGVDLAEYAARHRFQGRAGEILPVDLPPVHPTYEGALPWNGLASLILLVGIGAGAAEDYRQAGAAIARTARGRGAIISTVGSGEDRQATAALVTGLVLGNYRVLRRTSKEPDESLGSLTLLGDYDSSTVRRALISAQATVLARDLINTPSNIKNPQWLAEQFSTLAKESGLKSTRWDIDQLKKLGFGATVAVGSGSEHSPVLVATEYVPSGEKKTPHVVLVGKGITFDSGGISVKPRVSMETMKTDMSGAAIVFSVVRAVSQLKLPIRVTAVTPLAENAFGAASYRPGDVVRAFGGTTIEVLNTDAEGRMVLADALAYASAELEPDYLIDVATLTGAATLGLGKENAALFTASDSLAKRLSVSGRNSGEPLWRLPLQEEYRDLMASPVADVAQVPREKAHGAGSIVAALFLQRFATSGQWAHLDIAGPGRSEKDQGVVSKGGTGFGALALVDFIASLDA